MPAIPPILSTDVPGVAHLLLKKGQPFRLLHAKVALLGFRHRTEPGRWWLRLLVSTGNWTRQTVEESLDLAWRLDVTQEGCEEAADGIGQDRADIRAAWDLLQWLQGYVDTRLLDATTDGRPSESSLARQCVARWLDACGARAEAPRFFDSRKASLLKGLLKKLNNHGVKRCSRLVLGSGFFESGTDARKELVPLRIVREFKENSFLTSRPRVDIFVDPDSCQVMAKAGTLDSLKNAGFHLRPAAPPEAVFGERAATRNLHAKFIFSAASGRKDEDACCGAWLYLGSGNLTRPGFIDKMSSTGGNLEAGVLLFPPEGLRWKQKNGVNGVDAGKVITNLLPVQWDTEITTADALKSGPGKEEQREAFFAPPVAHLFWDDGDGQQTLGTRGTARRHWKFLIRREGHVPARTVSSNGRMPAPVSCISAGRRRAVRRRPLSRWWTAGGVWLYGNCPPLIRRMSGGSWPASPCRRKRMTKMSPALKREEEGQARVWPHPAAPRQERTIPSAG